MKTVENLLQAERNIKLGNHRMEHRTNYAGHNLRVFYYYSTPICTVNDTRRTFTIDKSYGTSSTTRACNAYMRKLIVQGYTEIVL